MPSPRHEYSSGWRLHAKLWFFIQADTIDNVVRECFAYRFKWFRGILQQPLACAVDTSCLVSAYRSM